MAISGPIVVPTLVDMAKKTMPSPKRDLGTILLEIVKTKIVSILNPMPCSARMTIKNPMECLQSKTDCAQEIDQ